ALRYWARRMHFTTTPFILCEYSGYAWEVFFGIGTCYEKTWAKKVTHEMKTRWLWQQTEAICASCADLAGSVKVCAVPEVAKGACYGPLAPAYGLQAGARIVWCRLRFVMCHFVAVNAHATGAPSVGLYSMPPS